MTPGRIRELLESEEVDMPALARQVAYDYALHEPFANFVDRMIAISRTYRPGNPYERLVVALMKERVLQ